VKFNYEDPKDIDNGSTKGLQGERKGLPKAAEKPKQKA
jgi:hypothetical protein